MRLWLRVRSWQTGVWCVYVHLRMRFVMFDWHAWRMSGIVAAVLQPDFSRRSRWKVLEQSDTFPNRAWPFCDSVDWSPAISRLTIGWCLCTVYSSSLLHRRRKQRLRTCHMPALFRSWSVEMCNTCCLCVCVPWSLATSWTWYKTWVALLVFLHQINNSGFLPFVLWS